MFYEDQEALTELIYATFCQTFLMKYNKNEKKAIPKTILLSKNSISFPPNRKAHEK